ncbi:hypothetical protein LBMAG18_01760 [Alphaproteobacteria bacterium]|nr:hypothetical protein LBMAG18_01760 [Alphaproteobacteria bacterium]
MTNKEDFYEKNNSSIFDPKGTNWIDDIEILLNDKHFVKHYQDNFFSLYASGYKDSANILCEHIIEKKRTLNRSGIVYPIIYLYRHYLELQLKNLILLSNKAILLINNNSFDDSYKKIILSHNLIDLYDLCLKNLKNLSEEIGEEESLINENEDFSMLKNIIKEFDKHDKLSEAFRYPVDKKNNFNLQKINNINIKKIYDMINEGTKILDGAEGWLDHQISEISKNHS